MAVFQPTYKDPKTGETRHTKTWWYEFTYLGKRIRESANTTRKTIAIEAEKKKRLQLERAASGLPTQDGPKPIENVSSLLKLYQVDYKTGHRAKSIAWVAERATHIDRLLGKLLLPDVTEAKVREYMRTRSGEGGSARTINMELGILARAMGRTWEVLWPKVTHLEENRDVGRALSQEEMDRLLVAAAKNKSHAVHAFVRIALLTGMRFGEIRDLRWEHVDLVKREITVKRAKTDAGRRTIPMNQDLYATFDMHAAWYLSQFGERRPEWYVFPFSNRMKPIDPTRPAVTIKKAWESVRTEAKVSCRFHDLRHTAVTRMAEAGVPEQTMKDLVGHISEAMLRRYTHIRMEAKRRAVEALSLSAPRSNQEIGVPQESPQVTLKTTIN